MLLQATIPTKAQEHLINMFKSGKLDAATAMKLLAGTSEDAKGTSRETAKSNTSGSQVCGKRSHESLSEPAEDEELDLDEPEFSGIDALLNKTFRVALQ